VNEVLGAGDTCNTSAPDDDDDDDDDGIDVQSLSKLLHVLHNRLQKQFPQIYWQTMPTEPVTTVIREGIIEQDLAFMTALITKEETEKLSALGSGVTGRIETLKEIVQTLREVEVSPHFYTNRLRAVEQLVGTKAGEEGAAKSTTFLTKDNFAYGSTAVVSFYTVFKEAMQLFASTAVGPSMGTASTTINFTVFGSSIGWLCFYAAFLHEEGLLRIKGYEILSPLVDEAVRIAAVYNVPSSIIHFHNCDMLTADISDCHILMLTSQCWDVSLIGQVKGKILRECHQGTVVIDYTSAMEGESGEKGGGGGNGGGKLVKAGVVPGGKASWGDIKFHLYLVQRG
jgi:hypothetical protein